MARFLLVWLAFWMAGAAADAAGNETDEAAAVAHFALIRPEADPANEAVQVPAGAEWLRRPQSSSRMPTPAAGAKRGKTTRNNKQVENRVAPLRRQRPKKETDPPKTRRRPLGW